MTRSIRCLCLGCILGFAAVLMPCPNSFGAVVRIGTRFIELSTERLEEVRDCMVVDRPYELGTEVEFTLEEGEAAMLNCSPNPYRIKECIIQRVLRPDIIQVIFLNDNGTILYAEGTDVTERSGALRQIGSFPYLSLTTWLPKDRGLAVAFRIETDMAENQELYKQYKEAAPGTMTLTLENWNAVKPPTLTELERISGFVRLWSEVKYNFAFFDQVPELNWDNVLDEYLPRVQKTKSTLAYYRLLSECIARLHDGHTSVWGPTSVPRGDCPVRVRTYQGKALIVQILPAVEIGDHDLRAEFQQANLQIGEELTHVGGRSVKEVFGQDIHPFVFASTPQGRDLKSDPLLFRGEVGSKANLRIKDMNGTSREVTLTRGHYEFQRGSNAFEYRDLEDGIAYVNLPSFGSSEIGDDFANVFPKIRQAQGLILDVRKNGGGSSRHGYAIVSCLIDETIKGSKWKTRQYMPAFRAWQQEEKWYERDARAIKPTQDEPFLGPVVVLTSARTNSAAEDFVVALHAGERAKVVGERTRGSTGQPLMIDLPGGGGARICTKRDSYPDGREFVGVGVIPDVEVCPTPADISTDRDIVLLEGIEEIKRMVNGCSSE